MIEQTLKEIFSNIPELHTNRLILRRMKRSDAADMYEYSKLPQVTQYLAWLPHTDLKATTRYLDYIKSRYAEGTFYDWAVIWRENNKMIGTCGFTKFNSDNNSAECGYVLNPAYWGKGIAPEALACVMKFGFMTLNLHRIECRYIVGNDRSLRVMEKCGMQYEGTMRDAMLIGSEYKTIGICSMLSCEYIRKYM